MSEPETKVPSLPTLSAVADPAVRTFLEALKQIVEVREQRRGNELDAFVKIRDITDAGIATYNRNRRKVAYPFPTDVDLAIPPAILNFEATGGYTIVFLTWTVVDKLTYANFGYVEIWRSAEDALGTATLIGQTSASLYADSCGSGKTFYYWARLVSKAGIRGPFNAVHGAVGTTAVDVDYMLQVLTGAITESQLYADLGARIDLIDAPEAALNSVNARIKTLRDSTDGSIAQVNTRLDVVESVDENLITAVNQIIVVDQGQASEIYLEQTARISADQAQAAQITSLTAQVDNNTALISNEQTARATADSALTTNINAALSRIGTAESTITSNYNTLAGVDSAQATALNTLNTTVNGNSASIQTSASSINGLQAQYTVKVDVNGYVSGYGLASTLRDATPLSEFGVRADRFYVGSPGQANIVPFIVTTTPTIVNGVSVPVGVYMDAAYIKNGTITNVKIGDAAIDTAKVDALSAVKITFGEMHGDRIQANTLNADRITTNTLFAKLASITDAYITTANIVSLDAGSITTGFLSAARIQSGSIDSKIANIDAAVIGTGTINSARIGNLDAGSITSGTINGNLISASQISMNTSGFLQGGVSGYAGSGSGFFLGYSGGQYKFSIGNPAGNYLTWDGSELRIKGSFTGVDYIAGDAIIASSAVESGTAATSWVPAKEVRVVRNGVLRIRFTLRTSNPGFNAVGQIWRNGVPVGTLRLTTNGGTGTTFTEDISGWTANDYLQIYYYSVTGSYLSYVSALQVMCANPTQEAVTFE